MDRIVLREREVERVRPCIVDGKPCSRLPSAFDGDFQCGPAIWYHQGHTEVIRDRCSRASD
jgi:hypothetical protein